MSVRLILSLTFFVFLFGILAPCASIADSEQKQKTIKARLTKQQKKIRRIQKGITGHQKKIIQSLETEQDLIADLETIDSTLREERQKLREFQTNLDLYEEDIHSTQNELTSLLSSQNRLKRHLQNRLAAFYRMGSIGYMNVIFSTSSLPDLLNFQEYFHRLLRQDQDIIENYRKNITALTQAKESLQGEKKEMLSVIVNIKDQELHLAESHRKRNSLLTRVRNEKKLYQRALKEMEQAAKELNQAMAKLKTPISLEEKRAKKRRQSPNKKRPLGIAGRKGRLPPPLEGTVTTFFGRNTKEKFGLTTFANGIDINPARRRAKIKAIFAGRIIFADKLRGYGKMIIIDHGLQYYSLISRATELNKNKGDLVEGGEVIGIIEEESGLLDEGLHFEMRQGTKPVNPLHWLDNSLLNIKKGR